MEPLSSQPKCPTQAIRSMAVDADPAHVLCHAPSSRAQPRDATRTAFFLGSEPPLLCYWLQPELYDAFGLPASNQGHTLALMLPLSGIAFLQSKTLLLRNAARHVHLTFPNASPKLEVTLRGPSWRYGEARLKPNYEKQERTWDTVTRWPR